MGLFEAKRRPDTWETDVLRRIGRMEADVESIKLQWQDYRDVLQRLVQRLEKRDMRAAERAEREIRAEPPAEDRLGGAPPDATTARILARRAMRNGHGIPE